MNVSSGLIWQSSSPSVLLSSSSVITLDTATGSTWEDRTSNILTGTPSVVNTHSTESSSVSRTNLIQRRDSDQSLPDDSLKLSNTNSVPSNTNGYDQFSNQFANTVTTAIPLSNSIDPTMSLTDPIPTTSLISSLDSTVSYTPWWTTTTSNLYESTNSVNAETPSFYTAFPSSSWPQDTSNDPDVSAITSNGFISTDGSSSLTWVGNTNSVFNPKPTISSRPSLSLTASSFIPNRLSDPSYNFNSNSDWLPSTSSNYYDTTSGVDLLQTPASSSPTTQETIDGFQSSSSAIQMPLSLSSISNTDINSAPSNTESGLDTLDSSSTWNPSTAEFYYPSDYTTSALTSTFPSTSTPYYSSEIVTTPVSSSYNWDLELSSTATASSTASSTPTWLSGWYSSWLLSSSPTVSPTISGASSITTVTTTASSSEQLSSDYNVFTTETPILSTSTSQLPQGTAVSDTFPIASLYSPSSSAGYTNTMSSLIPTSTTSSLINTVDTSLLPDTWGLASSNQPISTSSSEELSDSFASTVAPSTYSGLVTSETYNSVRSTTDDFFNTPTITSTSESPSLFSNTLPTTSFLSSSGIPIVSLSTDSDTESTAMVTSSSTSDSMLPTSVSSVANTALTSSILSPNPSTVSSSILPNSDTSSSSNFGSSNSLSSFASMTVPTYRSSELSSSRTTVSPPSNSKSSTSSKKSSFSSSEAKNSSSHYSKSSALDDSHQHSSSPLSSTSSINTGYSVSYSAKTAYYIYTQTYVITASTTTFGTGIPTTVGKPRSASTSFSAPKSIVTQDMAFYNHWSGNIKNHSHSHKGKNNDTGAIVGGVVGGVCGIVGCCLATWIVLRRRRNKKKNAAAQQGFSEEIGSRIENTSPPETPVAQWEEKPEEPVSDCNDNQLFSIFRTKRIPQASDVNAPASPFFNRNVVQSKKSGHSDNPFQEEFDFTGRSQTQNPSTPPPVPPPRKTHTTAQRPIPSRNGNHSRENRSSLVSSLGNSSYVSSLQGDYSTFSSGPIRLEPGTHNNSVSENPDGGFLREVI